MSIQFNVPGIWLQVHKVEVENIMNRFFRNGLTRRASVLNDYRLGLAATPARKIGDGLGKKPNCMEFREAYRKFRSPGAPLYPGVGRANGLTRPSFACVALAP